MAVKPPKRIAVIVPRQRTYARIPKGPRLYSKPAVRVDFPGEPPDGFLAGELHGSRSEWPIYAASWKAMSAEPKDGYRFPPFAGSPDGSFKYQAWELGGRSKSGGAVADFLYPALGVIVRVQSYRYHLSASPQVINSDELQAMRLNRDNTVIDVYEDEFLHLTGSDLVIWMKAKLGLIQAPNPIESGTVRPTR